jgi:hypothetical protein
MSEDKTNPTVNIDGTSYDLEQLSDKAKNMIGFMQRLDKEATELRYQLDKAGLARKQALLDLKEEVEAVS